MNKKLATLGLTAALGLSSCVGPFNLFNGVSSWNSRATDSKFLNELIYFGMWIIPIYQFSMLGDALIFNSLEFWGAENPIGKPEPFDNQSNK